MNRPGMRQVDQSKCSVCFHSAADATCNDSDCAKNPWGRMAGCSGLLCKMELKYACGFVHGFIACQVLYRLLGRLENEIQNNSRTIHSSLPADVTNLQSCDDMQGVKTETVVVEGSGLDSEPSSIVDSHADKNPNPALTSNGHLGSSTLKSDTTSSKECDLVDSENTKVKCQQLGSSVPRDVPLMQVKSKDSVFDTTHIKQPRPTENTIPAVACTEASSEATSTTLSLCSKTMHCPSNDVKRSGTKRSASASSTKAKARKITKKKTIQSEKTSGRGREVMTESVVADTAHQNQTKVKRQRHYKSYECDICFKTVQGKGNLNAHIKRMHSEVEPAECDICGRLCKSSVSLEEHKKRVHGSRCKICYICGAQLSTDCGLKSHLATHEGIKSHFCDVCGAGFVRLTSLRYHRKLHTEVRAFLCDLCSTSFKTAEGLNGHLLKKHNAGPYFDNRVRSLERLGVTVDRQAVRRYTDRQCIDCGENLDSGKCPTHPELSQKVFCCKECGFKKNDIVQFHFHMRIHRGEKIPPRPSMKGRSYQRVQPVKQDSTATSGFQCNICFMTFSVPSRLYNHKRLHQDRMYSCHVCSYKTKYKCNLNSHIRTHMDARPFQCDICLKSFKQKQALKEHKNLHGGDAASHKCEICGKILARRINLRNHYKLKHPGANI